MEWKLAEAEKGFGEVDAGERPGFREFLSMGVTGGPVESGLEDLDFDLLDLERDKSTMREVVL